jgi:hypothetical protein
MCDHCLRIHLLDTRHGSPIRFTRGTPLVKAKGYDMNEFSFLTQSHNGQSQDNSVKLSLANHGNFMFSLFVQSRQLTNHNNLYSHWPIMNSHWPITTIWHSPWSITTILNYHWPTRQFCILTGLLKMSSNFSGNETESSFARLPLGDFNNSKSWFHQRWDVIRSLPRFKRFCI